MNHFFFLMKGMSTEKKQFYHHLRGNVVAKWLILINYIILEKDVQKIDFIHNIALYLLWESFSQEVQAPGICVMRSAKTKILLTQANQRPNMNHINNGHEFRRFVDKKNPDSTSGKIKIPLFESSCHPVHQQSFHQKNPSKARWPFFIKNRLFYFLLYKKHSKIKKIC